MFDIIVEENYRDKGYGIKLLNEILTFAKINLVQKAYLQVVANNYPAIKLYEKVGFKEIYKYWYRVKEI